MSFSRSAALAALWSIAASLAAGRAIAQPNDADLRAARDLFVAAEHDEDGARWADALDKLQHVAQVRLTAGVRYHIALCEDHLGRLSKALADYTAAEEQARADGAQDVLRLVGNQLAALAPRVPRLTIRVLPGLGDAQVRLDGVPVAREVVGTPMPVDPGEHRAEATVPGAQHGATSGVVLHEGDTTEVDLRLPEPATAAVGGPGQPAGVTPETSSRSATRVGAILATTGAVVLAGAGVGAYLAADAQHANAVSACASQTLPASCDPQKNAVRAWDFAAAGAWLGAAAVGTVAVLLWLKPARDPAARTVAHIVVGPGVVSVGGRF
jgi:hypothetical protein